MAPRNPSERRALAAVLESEARFVAQLAATMGSAEVASTGPEASFGKEDIGRFVRAARSLLREARRQVAEEAEHTGPVPVYALREPPPTGR